MNQTHPLIPPGDFCYRVVPLQPGDVLFAAGERYGKSDLKLILAIRARREQGFARGL